MRWAAGLLVASAAVAAAAMATPSFALFTLALGLAAAALAGGASVLLARHRLTVARSIVEREVCEDAAVLVRVYLRGLDRLPVRVDAWHGGGWQPLTSHGGTVPVAIGRRGAYLIGPTRLRIRDVAGIAFQEVLAGAPAPVLILPVPAADTPDCPAAGTRSDDAELDGVQAYTAGTPISRIHWPSAARGLGLYERRLTPVTGDLPLVVVDAAGGTAPHAVDWLARTSAGCVLRLVRSGGCRVLLPGDATPVAVTDTAAWREVHRRLAVLAPAQVPGPRLIDPHEPAVCIRAADAPAGAPTAPALPPGVVPALPAGITLASAYE